MSRLRATPLNLAEANAFIARHHRHHQPVRFHLFSVGCLDDGGLRGVAIVMRPVNQHREVFGYMAEVCRLATDGTKNTCSFLLSRCARIAFEMGYMGIQTYTRDDEGGSSLRAAGWTFADITAPRSWCTSRRQRRDKTELVPRKRWTKIRADIARGGSRNMSTTSGDTNG